MKIQLVAAGLLMSLTATGAVAATQRPYVAQQHYATASTKKEAKLLATADARAALKASALCIRPAYQIDDCQAVDGGFRCRADSASNVGTCRRVGWVRDADQSRLPLAQMSWLYYAPTVGSPWGYATPARYSVSPDPFYARNLVFTTPLRIQFNAPN